MLDLSGLNPPQRDAVVHEGGPLLVFAGAGSGKTRVITHRVAWLVAERGVEPWRVLAVTFTNKAAGEMRERLGRLLPAGGGDVWVGTFHATCARLLRRFSDRVGIRRDFTIYDDGDQQALLVRVLRDLSLDERRFPPKQVAARINRAKQEVLGPADLPVEDAFDEIVQRLYATYEARLAQAGALDFGDLIHRMVQALEADEAFRDDLSRRFAHVLVDEFQDTNQAQYRLVRALTATHRNLCVVGDDDQSIYRWRGADRRLILDFRREFPDAVVVKLEQNYRSTRRILRVAHAVISRNEHREPKELWTENEEGAKVLVCRCEDERDEARLVVRALEEARAGGVPLAEIAVFYRTHAQSRVLEEALRAANVPYAVVGGMRFYDRAEVKDLLAYLRVVHNPDDDVSLLRVLNTPPRGIGKTTVDRLLDAAAREGTGLWRAIEGVETSGVDVGAAPRRKVAAFRDLLRGLREVAARDGSLVQVASEVLGQTGYADWLQAQDSAEADARLENVRELVGSLAEFEREAEAPTLSAYLERVTLETSADLAADGDRATLMTVHAAKGLEFALVLVTGLEEQVFPYRGADPFADPEELEEERRLAYVAFTRARERLVLSWAVVRTLFGQMRVSQPSRFLDELPEGDLERLGRRAPVPRPSGRALAAPPPRPGPAAFDAPAPEKDRGLVSGRLEVDRLRPGMRVRHARFGVGRVEEITPGTPPRVRVAFPGWGEKRIALAFLDPA